MVKQNGFPCQEREVLIQNHILILIMNVMDESAINTFFPENVIEISCYSTQQEEKKTKISH